MNLNKLMGVVIVLQSLILLGQWTGGFGPSPAHAADIPESMNRMGVMVDELRSMNSKMDKLIGIIEGGKIQVQLNNDGKEQAKDKDAK